MPYTCDFVEIKGFVREVHSFGEILLTVATKIGFYNKLIIIKLNKTSILTVLHFAEDTPIDAPIFQTRKARLTLHVALKEALSSSWPSSNPLSCN